MQLNVKSKRYIIVVIIYCYLKTDNDIQIQMIFGIQMNN